MERAGTSQGGAGRDGEGEASSPLLVQGRVAEKFLVGHKRFLRVAEGEPLPPPGNEGPLSQKGFSLEGELRRRSAEEIPPLHIQADFLLGQETFLIPSHQHLNAGRREVLHLERGAPQLSLLVAGDAESHRADSRPSSKLQRQAYLRKTLGRKHRRAAQRFPAIGPRQHKFHGERLWSPVVSLAHQGDDLRHLAGTENPPGREDQGLVPRIQIGGAADFLAVARPRQKLRSH